MWVRHIFKRNNTTLENTPTPSLRSTLSSLPMGVYSRDYGNFKVCTSLQNISTGKPGRDWEWLCFKVYHRSGNFYVVKFSCFNFCVKIFSWSTIPTNIFWRYVPDLAGTRLHQENMEACWICGCQAAVGKLRLRKRAKERCRNVLWEKRPMIYRTLSRKLSCLPRLTCEYWRGRLMWNN